MKIKRIPHRYGPNSYEFKKEGTKYIIIYEHVYRSFHFYNPAIKINNNYRFIAWSKNDMHLENTGSDIHFKLREKERQQLLRIMWGH